MKNLPKETVITINVPFTYTVGEEGFNSGVEKILSVDDAMNEMIAEIEAGLDAQNLTTSVEIYNPDSIWSEIRTEHIDDKGILHVDGYETSDDNESGSTLGYFFKGEFYPADFRIFDDSYGQAILKDLKEEYKTNPENFEQ